MQTHSPLPGAQVGLPPVMVGPPPLLIEPRELLAAGLRQQVFSVPLAQWLSQWLGIEGVNQLYAAVSHLPAGIPFYEGILRHLNVRVEVEEQTLRRIPASGALLAVANHPLGALEGVVLLLLLAKARPDARVMANHLLRRVPQLQDAVIPVDPFGGLRATTENRRGMRAALRHLQQAGALGVFPAGEVSYWSVREKRVLDPPWNPNVAGLAQRTQATVLPMYFAGSNGLAFQVGGLLHPRLRTVQLARELLSKRDHALEVRIGHPIPPEELATWDTDVARIAMLRRCTYFLAERPQREKQTGRAAFPWLPGVSLPKGPLRPVARGTNPRETIREVQSLGPQQCLATMGDLTVFAVEAQECPRILKEIGRLREISFRAAGEGSGKPRDLDAFDRHYQHLFVWEQQRQEIVGAYRLARVQDVLATRGPRGLYLQTLFHLKKGFFEQLGPALELGRSFVRPEYQRTPGALLMLWKGIGAYVLQHPECTRLVGPVSISNTYSQYSRQILVDFLREHASTHPLSSLVRPRHPFQPRRLQGWHPDLIRLLARELDQVSALIAEIEPDGKGVPVLLRQYLKLGGRILGFNVDHHFSDVLDGLILVDLLAANPKTLARYMGRDESAQFLMAAHARRQTDQALAPPDRHPRSRR